MWKQEEILKKKIEKKKKKTADMQRLSEITFGNLLFWYWYMINFICLLLAFRSHSYASTDLCPKSLSNWMKNLVRSWAERTEVVWVIKEPIRMYQHHDFRIIKRITPDLKSKPFCLSYSRVEFFISPVSRWSDTGEICLSQILLNILIFIKLLGAWERSF